MTWKLIFRDKLLFHQKYREQNQKTSKIPYSIEPKNRQSTINIKKAKKQKHHHKYQVTLTIVWYLADNNLAYVGQAPTKVEMIIEMT